MNLINKLSFFKYPSNKDIEIAKNLVEYHYILPTNLLEDIITLILCKEFKIKPDYLKHEDILQVLYERICNFGSFQLNEILIYALEFLKIIQNEFNLLSYEQGVVKLSDEINENVYNKEILNDIEEELIDKENIAEILKYTNILINKSGFKNKYEEITNNLKFKNLNDIKLLKKHNLLLPHFNFKILKKDFTVEKISNLSKNEEVLIYAEDASYSFISSKEEKISQAIKYFLLNTNKNVRYIRFSYDIHDDILLTNKKDKIKYFFNTKYKHYVSKLNYNLLFNYVNNFKNVKLFLISDNEDYFSLKYYNNIKELNFVGKHFNRDTYNISKLHNGKCINLI